MAGNNYSPYKVVDVTPTLSTAAYVDGDILFNKVEIPQAVIEGTTGLPQFIQQQQALTETSDVPVVDDNDPMGILQ